MATGFRCDSPARGPGLGIVGHGGITLAQRWIGTAHRSLSRLRRAQYPNLFNRSTGPGKDPSVRVKRDPSHRQKHWSDWIRHTPYGPPGELAEGRSARRPPAEATSGVGTRPNVALKRPSKPCIAYTGTSGTLGLVNILWGSRRKEVPPFIWRSRSFDKGSGACERYAGRRRWGFPLLS